MKFTSKLSRSSDCRRSSVAGAIVLLWSGILCPALCADVRTVRGFTEPNCTVKVATPEVGVIRKIHVREGDFVTAGQALLTLDDEIHAASLAILEEQKKAEGRLESAKAELRMRQAKLETLLTLQKSGSARPQEVDRAQTDLAISQAQVLAAQEEQAVRQLEYERARLQLQRRTVTAPLQGVIAKKHKQEGEFVTTHDAVLFEIVQLDPLVAVFPLPSPQVASLKTGQQVTIGFSSSDQVPGTIDFISPVTEGESGTVRVNVRVPNPTGQYRSGERCSLYLPALSASAL